MKVQNLILSLPVSAVILTVTLGWNLTPLRAADAFTLATAKAATVKGDAQAEYFLGKQYAHGNGVPQDYAQAAEYFRQAAIQGHAFAQNDLGSLYAKGLGVKQDYEAAATWYRQAAAQGDSLAEYSLGRAYSLGRGVPQDTAKAVKWYQKAADQNQPDALVTLGDLFMFGSKGITISFTKAFQCYTNAVAQGRQDCLNSLGLIYEHGYAGDHNPGMAVKCFREAAANRDAKAQMNLGRMYLDGTGVPEDKVEAYKWFVLSLRNGNMMARHYQESLEGRSPLVKTRLTDDQMSEAMRRVNEYNQSAANTLIHEE